jgi:hypothetical protein
MFAGPKTTTRMQMVFSRYIDNKNIIYCLAGASHGRALVAGQRRERLRNSAASQRRLRRRPSAMVGK